ncbi:MAG: lysylphosphatidylglycerol synthase domain-containing protein [Caulobacteraceae bacterium]|nr:lysylphosphatidylglycerol synthase domain-containing protein [Caulobacteraceae bacterium]
MARARRVWAAPARPILVSMVSLAGAAWLIHHVLRDFSWPLFIAALRATPTWAIVAAIVLTPASYVCLAVTEWFSLQSLGHRLSWHRAGRVAFASYAVSNSLGFSLATGTATRLRLYSVWGLSAAAITSVALLAGAAVSLSGVVTAGLGLLIRPAPFAEVFHWPRWIIEGIGLALLAPGVLWFAVLRRPAAEADTAALAHTRSGRAFALLAGVADWALSGAALYVLLPHPTLAGFPEFIAVFVLGSLVSAATGVPGGVGVFEAVVLGVSMLVARTQETATALILYRVIYSLGPLLAMSLGLGGLHMIQRRLRA